MRAAELLGFDTALWRELVAVEAPFMRLSADAGGGGMSLFDSCLMMEQAGRRLASVPLAEVVVALRILGELGGQMAREWIDGLSKEALSMAAAYACERIAFGQPIGANQGIAHPLAVDAIDADGGGLLLWWTLRAIADGHPEAAASRLG